MLVESRPSCGVPHRLFCLFAAVVCLLARRRQRVGFARRGQGEFGPEGRPRQGCLRERSAVGPRENRGGDQCTGGAGEEITQGRIDADEQGQLEITLLVLHHDRNQRNGR